MRVPLCVAADCCESGHVTTHLWVLGVALGVTAVINWGSVLRGDYVVERITKPMFVIHGENDPRVPVSEAHQIVDAARANKAPVWLLLGKNEGHGFARKSNLDFQFYSTIQFVREYLLGAK